MNKPRSIIGRIIAIIIALAIEVFLFLYIMHAFSNYLLYLETALRVVSILIVLSINKNSRHLSSDVMYIILILALPVLGTFIYILLHSNLVLNTTYHKLKDEEENYKRYYYQDETIVDEIKKNDSNFIGQVNYITDYSKYPIYRNQYCKYYELGDYGFPEMLNEIRKAKKFIFLEYFIIKKGTLWKQIYEVLCQKAKQGVEVRVMYDDFGSFFSVNTTFINHLQKRGIKAVAFNEVMPILSTIMNHRDHRKILVVDGEVAFTGGINLADEYINVNSPYGHWKDNVIEVKGNAVNTFTVMFLNHWNALKNEDQDITPFLNVQKEPEKYDGFIAPFGETPLDKENTAQNIYMNILNEAVNYVYIFTPYLLIDTEMENALLLAAKRGVDVHIVTPGIPDKKLVWNITKSYYHALIEGGVHIDEYTPGFDHAKVFVSDDKVAVVGTINLDYRSLYLHFENGVFLYDSKEIINIKNDFLNTFPKCHQVTLQESKNSIFKEFFLSVLRLIAPLM